VPLRGRARVVAGLRKPASWLQLIQFGAVGASGFIVNLIVYSALLEGDVPYRAAAVVAFCVAVGNNFTWNRLWTFRHRRDASHAAFQAARFFTVAVTAFLLSFVLLLVLVEGFGVGKIVAQLVAVSLVMPLSFLGNKLWSFR
jgi:dolichol-phosphate mannosyltransferase